MTDDPFDDALDCACRRADRSPHAPHEFGPGCEAWADLVEANTPDGHRQVHRPHDGASECTCGDWIGPATTLDPNDPRSHGAHLAAVAIAEETR